MSTTLIKNGFVIDPSQGIEEVADILIQDSEIAGIGKNFNVTGVDVIYATGRIIVPGLVDMHVHTREPGSEGTEDIQSCTGAAVRGGITSILAMPNTNPVIDNKAMVDYIMHKGRSVGRCSLFVCAAITVGQAGETLTETGQLRAIGAVALSDDGRSVKDTLVMRRAMEYACAFDIPILDHAEDETLSKDGVMHEGVYSLRLGLRGIPSASEEIVVARDIALSELTGCRIHICHVSTAGAVRLIREAKQRGIHITCETAPHYLIFTDQRLTGYNTNFKVKPPIRTSYDRDALIKGLQDGTIDAIATDHAPHPLHSKEQEFDAAAFGINSLEISLSACIDALYHTKKVSIKRLIDAMSCAPAKILGLAKKGAIKAGNDADLTVIEPGLDRAFTKETMLSKSCNSPYLGKTFKGDAIMTISRGNIAYRNTEMI